MSDILTLKGEFIVLRSIKPSDIDDRLDVGRPNEFKYMCGGNRTEIEEFPLREEWETWYQFVLEKEYAWMIEYDGKCIGSAELQHVSKEDRSAEYAIGIWDAENFSKGIGTEATKLVLGYAFNALKLHRIDLKVLDYNKRARKCYEKCGFKVDGILRESAFIEGAYHSDIVMSILEDEFCNL